MSENNESHQAQAGAQAPRVARSASSQPLSGTEQSQAHENMAAASGGVKVREKARRGAPRARRMSLSLTRIDAWSAAKVAFMLSIAGGIIQIVAVTLLWLLLNVVGVFDQVTQIVSSTGLDAGGFDLANVLSLSTVLSAVTIFCRIGPVKRHTIHLVHTCHCFCLVNIIHCFRIIYRMCYCLPIRIFSFYCQNCSRTKIHITYPAAKHCYKDDANKNQNHILTQSSALFHCGLCSIFPTIFHNFLCAIHFLSASID